MNCKIVEFFLKKFRGKWTFFDPNIFILREKEKRFRHEIAGVIMVDETISITGLTPCRKWQDCLRFSLFSIIFVSFVLQLAKRSGYERKKGEEKGLFPFEENIRSGEICINPILFPH